MLRRSCACCATQELCLLCYAGAVLAVLRRGCACARVRHGIPISRITFLRLPQQREHIKNKGEAREHTFVSLIFSSCILQFCSSASTKAEKQLFRCWPCSRDTDTAPSDQQSVGTESHGRTGVVGNKIPRAILKVAAVRWGFTATDHCLNYATRLQLEAMDDNDRLDEAPVSSRPVGDGGCISRVP